MCNKGGQVSNRKNPCMKDQFNGCCCCNCANHIEDLHHCTTVKGKHDDCVCSKHKGWICIIEIEPGNLVAHSGWPEHGMCEMHTKTIA